MKKIGVTLLSLMMIVMSMTVVRAEKYEDKVNDLLNHMSLEEKIGQMIQADTRSITPGQVAEYNIGSILSGGGAGPYSGNSATEWAKRSDEYQKAAIEGTGIPLLYGIDAVHGNNNVDGATILPHNIGLGQANNSELMKELAKVTAKEMRAIGANWTFTPTLGLPKNERWGRTYECFGESAQLSSSLGSSFIKGLQGTFGDQDVIATAKHFIGEGIAKNGTNQGDIDGTLFNKSLDELLIPYKSAISSGARSVMVTYNSIDGQKVHGKYDLLTTLLKEDLGFDGIVISDYNGVDQIEGNLSYKDKIIKGVNAGIDMLMIDGSNGSTPNWKIAIDSIKQGVQEGAIQESRIDDAVRRILTVKGEMGLLMQPEKAYSNATLLNEFGSDDHRNIARKAVRESLTLLKNSKTDNDSTLMLDLKNMNRIVVAGSSADDIGMQCGGWTISWQGSKGNITKGTTVFSGLREVAKEGTTIDYSANGYFSEDDYEAAIIVVGEEPYAEGNGDRSAKNLKLLDSDIKMIERIKNTHPDLPIVAVLTTGRPVTIAEQLDDLDAIVMAGFPGTEGAGVADVLLGDYDFNGALTFTWPWYAQDIEEKFSDSSKVLFEYGRGLKKSESTPIQDDRPTNPSTVDLSKTNGILEAENFVSKHKDIVLENNDTSIGYFWDGRDISYDVIVPEKARYILDVAAATENSGLQLAFDVYVDDILYYSSSTDMPNTGGWANFQNVPMNDYISLPNGRHTLKIVSQMKDVNIDKFIFTKYDDSFEEPEIKPEVPNEGSGAVIKDDAVSVTMSSSDNSGDMSWYAGDQEIEHKNTKKDNIDLKNIDETDVTSIVINNQQTYQSVLGIGTSVEESTVNNLLKMSDAKRKEFIKQLVDPKTGMGNTLFRVTIGTADFTGQDFYTYYDGSGKELNGNPDWYNETGNGFSIQKDIDYGIVKVIKEIQDVAKEVGVEDEILFFASSWTPPGWMKDSTSASNSYPNNNLMLKGGKLKDSAINDLAKYYVRFVEEYQKLGIPMYAMTLQNEPLLEIDYPSCYITGKQEAKLSKAIKDELHKSDVLLETEKDIKVWAFDHNFDGADAYVQDLFSSSEGRENVDGIAFHPYGGSPSTMGALYNQYKDQYTMHLTERSVWGASGINDIITWFRNGSESYNAWVTMLDSKISPHQWVGTPDPTMFVQDANNREKYWSTPEVYLIGQVSKYVRPGYQRIASSNGTENTVTNVAFKNPETGEIILIVANSSSQTQDFKVILNGTQFNATLPKGNVATYIWDPVDTSDYKVITDELNFSDAQIENAVLENDVLGYIGSNTKVSYTVNVKQPGDYRVVFDVACGGDWNKEHPIVISQGDTKLGQATTKRYNWWGGEWENYNKTQTYVTFEEEGIQTFTLTFPEAGLNFKGVQFIKEDRYQSIPGKLTNQNSIAVNDLVYEETNYGFSSENSYIDYMIDVKQAGSYEFVVEAATKGDKHVDFSIIGETEDKIGSMDLIDTNDHSVYTQNKKVIALSEGKHQLRVRLSGEDLNLRSIIIGQALSIESPEIVEGEINGSRIKVTLENAQFQSVLNKEQWNLTLPKGVDFNLERVEDTIVWIELIGEAIDDFDQDLFVQISINASEFNGLDGTKLMEYFTVTAVDDDETLMIQNEVQYGTTSLELKIEGGTFNETISKEDIVIKGSASQYVEIINVERISSKKITVTLSWNPLYEDITSAIVVSHKAYSDGINDLEKDITFKATTELPKAIIVDENSVHLSESVAYRHNGSLKENPAKGNYIDFFLDIKEEGDYVIELAVKNNAAAPNALKLSGGALLATDNLASISFSNFWNNQLGYKTSLHLQEGKQTIRFEMNNYVENFEMSDITIQKKADAIKIGSSSTLSASQLYSGSKELGWGIEEKEGISNVGCSSDGAYQDFYVDVQEEGEYTLVSNVAYGSNKDVKFVLQSININDNVVTTLGKQDVIDHGGWGQFENTESIKINLEKGLQVLRVLCEGDGFNYRFFTLTKGEIIDNEAPMIYGESAIIYLDDSSQVYEILNLEIIDNIDGVLDLLGNNVTIETDFDSKKVGVYSVKVIAIDKAGNKAEENYTIEVVKPATMTYKVSYDTVVKGDTFDPFKSVTITDCDGKNITKKATVIGTVDTQKVGTYTLTYQVIDQYGRLTTFERVITVKDKNKPTNPETGEKPEIKDPEGETEVVEEVEIPGVLGDIVEVPTDDNSHSTLYLLTMLGSFTVFILIKRKKKIVNIK